MKTLVPIIFLSSIAAGANSPTTFPVFLKMGFSSVLEFDEAPTRVVLGDAQTFQVERLERSLVIRALAPYATSNMFVYFRAEPPRLFVLTSSEDAEPTYYKSFEAPKIKKAESVSEPARPRYPSSAGTRLLTAQFDDKKDYLTVEVLIAADSKEALRPKWEWVRLIYNRAAISPDKVWAERKEVQKDSRVRARFIFIKPNIPRNLAGTGLVIPLQGQANPLRVTLSKRFK